MGRHGSTATTPRVSGLPSAPEDPPGTGSAGRARARNWYLRVWLVVFGLILTAGVMVQTVVLPRLLPTVESEYGLLTGSDSPKFHRLAVSVAERIRSEGWSGWELRPSGQAPAGIAAGIYALIGPEPLALLPLNAAVHATAAVVLMAILARLLTRPGLAAVAVIPFVLYPSTLRWTTQIHKDGYTILGFYLFTFGMVLMADPSSWRLRRRTGLLGALSTFVGMCLIWIVRDYMALMLHVVAVVPFLLIITALLRSVRRGEPAAEARPWFAVLVVASVFFGLLIFSRSDLDSPASQELVVDFEVPPPAGLRAAIAAYVDWQSTTWMPEAIDRQLRSLAHRRARYLMVFPEAGSNIDGDVVFHRTQDILRYLPRALMIAALAPFPETWAMAGTTAANTIMRRVAGPEMAGIYLGLALLPFAVWRWRRRLDLWIVLWLCAGMLLGYGLVVANVGTLYRMRYPYVMMLVGLGLAGFLALWEARREHRRSAAASAEDAAEVEAA